MNLAGAERVSYLLEQSFRYEYSAPIEQLRHRLVVFPPVRHGDQHLRSRRLSVVGAAARRATRRDVRGNTVVRVRAERVEASVRFEVSAVLDRVRGDGPVRLPAAALTDPRLLRATRLTTADGGVRELAHAAVRSAGGAGAAEVAIRVCEGVHRALAYADGATDVSTTAAQALAGGRGVCQDSAHLMLAACHVLGLPARYVSGHLLGQGGTHAWVEVVIPAGDGAIAVPYDPCHGRPADAADYLTVATGRDYNDVTPTSGTYLGARTGQLTATRQLSVLAAA